MKVNRDDNMIDLREEVDLESKDMGFHKNHIDNEFDNVDIEGFKEKLDNMDFEPKINNFVGKELEIDTAKTSNMVTINFVKFVNLLSKYDVETLSSKFRNEKIFLNTNLLADLAQGPEEEDDARRVPVSVFIVCIVLAILITWLILR